MNQTLPNAFIFGAGSTGETLLPSLQNEYNIIAFLDNDEQKWNKKLNGFKILSPDAITKTEYDYIIIGTNLGESVTKQLLNMGVPNDKIITGDRITIYAKGRVAFLEGLKILFDEMGIKGSVAEGGVFQGDFAKEINRVFSNHKFYLFDTFEGFDERDVMFEKENKYSTTDAGHFNITSEEMVLNKLPNPDMCIIKKGYFPDTVNGIDDEFCFVNLDFDLYKPILAGLEYFYPRMVKGGVILIDDFYASGYKGAKKAVYDFINKNDEVKITSIGDNMSVAICC